MNMNEKIALIKKALETETELTASTVLEKVEEWDSMGKIAIVVMLDKNFKVTLTADQIEGLKTMQDILAYME